MLLRLCIGWNVAYSFRDDSRRGGERSYEGWAFKAQEGIVDSDDNIRPWLGGFVAKHGDDKAKSLLKGSGLPKGYSNDSTKKNWTIMFIDEILGVNETKGGGDARVGFDNFVRKFYQNGKQLDGIV